MRFRAPWWSWPILGLALLVLGGLGTWQLHRAQAKQDMLAQRVSAGKTPPVTLAAVPETAGLYGKRVQAVGRYLPDQQILLDNQVRKGQAGYHVWTPLALDDGRLVMVDRGWVAMNGNRAQTAAPAAPEDRQQPVGLWRRFPEPGLRLRAPDACKPRDWPRVLNYPATQQVACQYPVPVLDGLLLLDESLPGGFPRDWQDVGLPPIRHIGYAVQWYAMAVAVLVIFVAINLKRQQ